MTANVTKATLRQYELREARAWAADGWLTQPTWKQAIFIGAGRLITKPKDFFDAFDLVAVHPRGMVAFVQVTASPFVKTRDGKADRNAAHGEPPFAFSSDQWYEVDTWMRGASFLPPALGTIIVSYADPRNPERRWWTRLPHE
jgi:hypothetical protein